MGIKEYIEHMRAKNRKETTLEGYAASIRACERCLRSLNLPTDPGSVTPETFEVLQRSLTMRETSKHVRLRAYGHYIAWETGHNPMAKAELLWNPEKCDPHFITPEDFRKCFSFFSPPSPYRIMLLLGSTMGLRRTEMARLTVGDYHGNTMTVHGKGHGPEGDVREQRVPADTRKEIELYLKWRREKTVRDGILSDSFLIFEEKYGHCSVPEFMEAAISYHFKRMSRISGVKVTPHSLRRLYATTLYKAGTDILTISRLMRHANPSITWRYIQQTEDRTDVVDSLSILLNIGDTITI